jgi:hypothetical protein
MSRLYETLFRESGVGTTRAIRCEGNTKNGASRRARRELRDTVGDTSRWYEVCTTFVPKEKRGGE